MDVIDKADFAGRNKFFMWYIRDIVPIVQKQAVREANLPSNNMYGSVGNLSENHMNPMPINCVMREFFMKYGISNEKQKN